MLMPLMGVIVGSAAAIQFSQELTNLYKKICGIPGMKLFLSLMLTTLMVYVFETLVRYLLLALKKSLQSGILILQNVLPFESTSLAMILLLSILAFFPLMIMERHKKWQKLESKWLVQLFVWLFGVVLLLVSS